MHTMCAQLWQTCNLQRLVFEHLTPFSQEINACDVYLLSKDHDVFDGISFEYRMLIN